MLIGTALADDVTAVPFTVFNWPLLANVSVCGELHNVAVAPVTVPCIDQPVTLPPLIVGVNVSVMGTVFPKESYMVVVAVMGPVAFDGRFPTRLTLLVCTG